MTMVRRVCWLILVLAVAVSLTAGTAALFSEVQARGPCICPQIYAPVECDKGKVYPNACVAACRNAKNCVPVGIF